jgi:DNA-binding response OmpR family regulator
MTGQPPGARGSAVILVVERDPHVRELEGYFLERAGFTVQFAQDGEQALRMVRSVEPDLVITEVLVPRVDGLAVCRRIKEDSALSGTAVLVFSILAVGRRASEAGADAFLLKPLAEKSLVETVKELLAMRREAADGA